MSLSTLFQRKTIVVSVYQTLVIVEAGNLEFSLEFDVALSLAMQMQRAARTAKQISGDNSRNFRSAGKLSNADQDQPKPGRFGRQPPTVTPAKQVAARTAGKLVQVTLGRTTLGLPYEAALTIAQWLRINGRAAKANAGESAHWSEVIGIGPAQVILAS